MYTNRGYKGILILYFNFNSIQVQTNSIKLKCRQQNENGIVSSIFIYNNINNILYRCLGVLDVGRHGKGPILSGSSLSLRLCSDVTGFLQFEYSISLVNSSRHNIQAWPVLRPETLTSPQSFIPTQYSCVGQIYSIAKVAPSKGLTSRHNQQPWRLGTRPPTHQRPCNFVSKIQRHTPPIHLRSLPAP